MNNYQFIEQGSKISLLDNQEESIITLEKAVGFLALSLYSDEQDFLKTDENAQEREPLKKRIKSQTEVLNSLSNALTALKPYVD